MFERAADVGVLMCVDFSGSRPCDAGFRVWGRLAPSGFNGGLLRPALFWYLSQLLD